MIILNLNQRNSMKYLCILLVLSLYAADNQKSVVRLMDMQPRKVKKTVLMSGEWPRKDMPEFGTHKNRQCAYIPLDAAQTNKIDDKKVDEQAK